MRERVTIEPLPAGDEGTERTLRYMAQAVRGELAPDFNGYQSEAVRGWAIKTVAGMRSGFDSEVAALFRAVRDGIRYRRDPVNTERVQDALITLQQGSGDCDDKVTLLATALAALGWVSRFVVQRQTQGDFDHVYLEALNERTGEWVALDPTADGQSGRLLAPVGWRNQALTESYYAIFDEAPTMAGITGLGDFFTGNDGIDWNRALQTGVERGLDVLGARYGNSNVYVSPDDPRYRANVNIYRTGGYPPNYRQQLSDDQAGASVSTFGTQLNIPWWGWAGIGIVVSSYFFGKGRRK